jgi:hypothetical protein
MSRHLRELKDWAEAGGDAHSEWIIERYQAKLLFSEHERAVQKQMDRADEYRERLRTMHETLDAANKEIARLKRELTIAISKEAS